MSADREPPLDEIRSWHPEDRPASAAQQRKQLLADHLRGLIADVLMLDSAAIGADGFAEAEELLAKARAHVAGLPEIRDKGGLLGNPDDFSLFERSPFSGKCNALATPMTMTFEGHTTKAHATYGDAYEGPRGSVHGGHVIAAFDDLLGVAQSASGSPGLTGTLSVRLVARTPLHERIDYEAGVESHSGRKVVAWGRSYHGETLLAEASAVFITPRGGILAAHPTTSD